MAGPALQVSRPACFFVESYVIISRINEFNVNEALALFLPYHETPHFAKLLSILHIRYVLQNLTFVAVFTFQ